MYAHKWALCCLITVTSFPAFAADANVEVLLQNSGVLPELMLREMKLELSSLMVPAGYEIHWRGTPASPAAISGDLVVVELRGSCVPPSDAILRSTVVQLGSSAVADGKVLPFSWVDCTELARMLEPHLAIEDQERRDLVYGRAIARVLAHELYHVLGHTLAHTETGLTKARFELSDLLDERTTFGSVAMAHLQLPLAPRQRGHNDP